MKPTSITEKQIASAPPAFPDFKPLEIADRETIQNSTRRFAPYSDYSFVNLVCYNIGNSLQFSRLNENLVVRLLDYMTQEPIFSFIGDQKPLETIHTLLAFSKSMKCQPALRLVPEESITAIPQSCENEFQISKDIDSFDYIHLVEDLAELANKQFAKKRKSIDCFRRGYPHCKIKEINLCNGDIQSGIRQVMELWRIAKNKTNDDVAVEFIAIDRCLRFSDKCELVSVGAFINDQLMGFTINEVVHSGFYIAHFGKACPQHKGLGTLLEHETAKIMRRLGCTHMNYQQDLGLPGLRMAKHSWHPSSFLKKYTITAIL